MNVFQVIIHVQTSLNRFAPVHRHCGEVFFRQFGEFVLLLFLLFPPFLRTYCHQGGGFYVNQQNSQQIEPQSKKKKCDKKKNEFQVILGLFS